MLPAVSQINFSQPYNKYNSRVSFKDVEKTEKEPKVDLFEKEKKDIDPALKTSVILNYVLAATLLGGVLSYILFNKKGKPASVNMPEKLTFESFKNDKSIPTLDECKSLNSTLKNLSVRQIELSRADNELIEAAGNPSTSNRFLISGPTGVGKTFYSKIFAKTIDAEYIEVLYSDLNSKWAGEVEGKMSNLFNFFLKTGKRNPDKKYVVTFNEFDSMLSPIEHLHGENGSTHFASLRRQRSTFITYNDKLQKEAPNVIIIGTTNMLPNTKNLDGAIMGRFKNIVEISYPDKNNIYEALKVELESVRNNEKFISENDDKLKEISKIMADRKYSFRNLENVVNDAKTNYLEDLLKDKNASFKFEYLDKAQKSLVKSDGEREAVSVAKSEGAPSVLSKD